VAIQLNQETHVGEIGLNAVHPDHAGKGVGTTMYNFALAQLPRSKPCFGSMKARKSYKCLIFHEELWPCI
jgi:GNAT superfamily N-acetyltransferase